MILLLRDTALNALYYAKHLIYSIHSILAYCIWHVETDIEIDVLDMVNETYIGHTRPALLSDWNGQLSFIAQVKDELHVMVLNDYRKLLNFLKPDNKELMTYITVAHHSLLFFVKESLCSYDIYTGRLNTCVLRNCIHSYGYDRDEGGFFFNY